MIKSLLVKGALMLLTFFYAANSFAQTEEAKCFSAFNELRTNYLKAEKQMTVSVSNSSGMTLHRLLHIYKDNKSISYWENLNGEIRGYALKGDVGFDFNQDKEYAGQLTWHQTLIWDRLFNSDTDLTGFSCVLTGRTRVAGQKVSLIRLAPKDSYRYGYLIAKDDVSAMPVELAVLSPNSGIITKITVNSVSPVDGLNLDLSVFDNLSEQNSVNNKEENSFLEIWPELNIPKEYKLVEEGEIEDNGAFVPYQLFSDGLTTFRVYKNAKTSVVIPALTNGTISILRKSSGDYEYAVVGEIPILFAESVLSDLPR